MSRSSRAAAHVRRDAALRRLRVLNRFLIGGAVAATGLLTDVTAHAFTGHKRRVVASTPAPAPTVPQRASHGAAARHRAHHARHHRRALRPPTHAPTPATTTSAPQPTTTSAAPAQTAPAQTAPAQTAPAQPAQPAPAPASAPTVSGGS